MGITIKDRIILFVKFWLWRALKVESRPSDLPPWTSEIVSKAFGRALGRPSGFQADIVQNFTYPKSSSQNVYTNFEHFYSFGAKQILHGKPLNREKKMIFQRPKNFWCQFPHNSRAISTDLCLYVTYLRVFSNSNFSRVPSRLPNLMHDRSFDTSWRVHFEKITKFDAKIPTSGELEVFRW